jgi:hypothetical protein
VKPINSGVKAVTENRCNGKQIEDKNGALAKRMNKKEKGK